MYLPPLFTMLPTNSRCPAAAVPVELLEGFAVALDELDELPCSVVLEDWAAPGWVAVLCELVEGED